MVVPVQSLNPAVTGLPAGGLGAAIFANSLPPTLNGVLIPIDRPFFTGRTVIVPRPHSKELDYFLTNDTDGQVFVRMCSVVNRGICLNRATSHLYAPPGINSCCIAIRKEPLKGGKADGKVLYAWKNIEDNRRYWRREIGIQPLGHF